MPKFSINQQIEEVERELKKRADVYPRQVHMGKMTGSQAEYFLGRMNAVRDTLVWCRIHEAEIRQWLQERRNASAHAENTTSTDA